MTAPERPPSASGTGEARPAASGSEKARLFVALDLPHYAREALTNWARRELQPMASLRLIPSPYLHVTLCFLGWRALSDVEPIAEACRAAVSAPAFSLTIGAPLWLPPRRPRVAAVALSELPAGSEPVAGSAAVAASESAGVSAAAGDVLAGLQSELGSRLHADGFYEPEDRPFLAHVTVARVARSARVRPVELPAPEPLTFVPPAVTLYRSRPEPGGARYEPLASVALPTAT